MVREPQFATRQHCLILSSEVHSYTGKEFNARTAYDIKNVLQPIQENFHCSGKGVGHTLILKTKDNRPVQVTHLFVAGPGLRCTEPCKSGLVWFSDTEPKVEWGDQYQKMSPEDIQKAVDDKQNNNDGSDDQKQKPDAYWVTDPTTRKVELDLSKTKPTGKFVMVRFIDTHNKQENVDVAVFALAGYRNPPPADAPQDKVHSPGSSFFNRQHTNRWVHPQKLESTFSGGGWVCDGRDYSGGCRSGMVSFHQSTPYMVTFRCQQTGFDLCESCVRDPSFGKVTSESIRIDLLTLEEMTPELSSLTGLKGHSPTTTANRIAKVIQHSPRTLMKYFESGLIDTICRVLEQRSESRENSRQSRRSQRMGMSSIIPRMARGSAMTSWRVNLSLTREVVNVLFNENPGCLAVGDKVWTKRPNDSMEWGLGKVTSLPTASSPGVLVTFPDDIAAVERQPGEVWKMVVEEELMMATASLYQEIKSCDEVNKQKIERCINSGADPFAFNGEGMNVLLTAIDEGKIGVVRALLELGVCPDADSFSGTPLELAQKLGHVEIEQMLIDHGCTTQLPVDQGPGPGVGAGAAHSKTIEEWRSEVARRLLAVLFANVGKLNKASASAEGASSSSSSGSSQDCVSVLVDLITKCSREDLVDALQVQRVAQDFAGFLQSSFASDSIASARLALQVVGSVLAKKDTTLTKFLLASGAQQFASKLITSKNSEYSMVSGSGRSDRENNVDELHKTAKIIAEKFALQEAEFGSVFTHPSLESLSSKLENGDLAALDQLRTVLRKMKRIDFRESDRFLTPYMLDRYGIAKKLLNFFHGVKVMEGNHFIASGSVEDRWQAFHEIFAGDDLDVLLDALHGLISMSENLPVYRYKRERALKVLTDPFNLKLSFHLPKDVYRPDMAKERKIEPLVSIDQLSREILSTTAVPDKKFLEACFGLIDCQVEFDDGRVATVTDFRISTDLNLPVHTVKYVEGSAVERTLLSLRKVKMKQTPTSSDLEANSARKFRSSDSMVANKIPFLKHRVALAQLKIATSPVVFNSICADLLKVFEAAEQGFGDVAADGKKTERVEYDKKLLKQDIPAPGKWLFELCDIAPSPAKRTRKPTKDKADDEKSDYNSPQKGNARLLSALCLIWLVVCAFRFCFIF